VAHFVACDLSNDKTYRVGMLILLLLLSAAHLLESFVTHSPIQAEFLVWARQGNDDYEDMSDEVKKLVESFDPQAFPGSSLRKPDKSDIYEDGDLENILNLHQQLSESMPSFGERNETDLSPSLHDLVLQDLERQLDKPVDTVSRLISPKWNERELEEIVSKCTAVASDVDGTLLSSEHSVHPKTREGLNDIISRVKDSSCAFDHFFLATGKTRAGALNSLGPELAAALSSYPGVFIQGLFCVDEKGQVVFERKLNNDSVGAALAMAKEHELSLFAYRGDYLLASEQSNPSLVRSIHEIYGEPLPEIAKSNEDIADAPDGWHKVLLLHEDDDWLKSTIRPKLDELARANNAATTQAVPCMLELLPYGMNKAAGVAALCEHLGVDPSNALIALGDGENDIEMLQMAACGIAMRNAQSHVKDCADAFIDATNNDGGAGDAFFALLKASERRKV